MKKYHKLCGSIISICILVMVISFTVLASETTNTTVTRAEWIQKLVETFEMTVEDDNYPDNYFSDLKSSSKYYYDILVAVQFGVVKVEAGDPVYPDMPVTREFAASTLNYCLAFQLEDKTYTFSDAGDCTYPEDDQIALNRKWFTLVSGKFMPDETISVTEAKTMLEDAYNIWHSSDVEEGYDNTYEFADDVKVLSDNLVASIDNQGIVTIHDIDKTIKNGDKFAVWLSEVPVVYTALDVTTTDNITTIRTEAVNNEEAFDELDAQGILDASALIIEPVDGVTTTYEEEPSSNGARIGGSIGLGKKTKISVEQAVKLTSSATFEHKTEISNAQIEYKLTGSEVTLKFTGNIKSSYGVKGKVSGDQFRDMTIVPATIPGIGGLDVILDLEISGVIKGTSESYTVVGFTITKNDGFRPIINFNAKSFSLTSQTTGKAGVKVRLGATGEVLPVKGYVYASAGGKAMMKAQAYKDGEPKECRTFAAWVYAEGGAKIEKKSNRWSFIKKNYEFKYEVYTETNSPLRVYHHYEDGKEVAKCSRGNDFKYYTSIDSKYWESGWTDGIGTYGYDADGNRIELYTYTLDDDNNATITGYKGNAANLYIPETIDGYTVVEIGDKVFWKKENIESVSIPDTVTYIGKHCFEWCTALTEVKLPANLTTLESAAFGNCPKLVKITIPKAIKTAGGEYGFGLYNYGPFFSCKNLKTVILEDGMKTIPSMLFAKCYGLQQIEIPESVTSIGGTAFKECTSLESISIPDSVTSIDSHCFESCTTLKEVKLSKNLTTLGSAAFGDCDELQTISIPKTLVKAEGEYGFGLYNYGPFFGCKNLKTVILENGIKTIPALLFAKCYGLENIEIPESVTTIGDSAFLECTAMNSIDIASGVTKIGSSVFQGCTSLEKIVLPDNTTSLGAYLFNGCTSLVEVTLNNTRQNITSYMFQNCTSLEKITLPDTVTEISDHAFKGCTSLKEIVLGKELKTIKEYAFEDCDALTEVIIPEGVTSIGNGVFAQNKL